MPLIALTLEPAYQYSSGGMVGEGQTRGAPLVVALLFLLLIGVPVPAHSTDLLRGMTGLKWSPSGERMVAVRVAVKDGRRPFDILGAAPLVSAGAKADAWNGIWLFRKDGRQVRKVCTEPEVAQWVGDKHLLVVRSASPPAERVTWSLLDLRGKRIATIVAEAPEVLAWEVSPDGRYLAYIGSWPHEDAFRCATVLYRFRDRRTVGKYAISVVGWSMAWSPDSRYVYGPESDRDWRLDAPNGKLEEKVRSLRFPGDADFAVSNTGQLVVATEGPEGGGLNLIDWATGKEQWIAKGTFSDIAFGRDPNLFVCAKQTEGRDEGVRLGRLHAREWTLSQLKSAPGGVIALSHDSKRLAYVDAKGNVKVVPIPAE